MASKHIHAEELSLGDNFTMAGTNYTITYLYSIEDEDFVKFAFHAITENSTGRSNMTVPRDLLFFVTHI